MKNRFSFYLCSFSRVTTPKKMIESTLIFRASKNHWKSVFLPFATRNFEKRKTYFCQPKKCVNFSIFNVSAFSVLRFFLLFMFVHNENYRQPFDLFQFISLLQRENNTVAFSFFVAQTYRIHSHAVYIDVRALWLRKAIIYRDIHSERSCWLKPATRNAIYISLTTRF